MPIDRKDPRLQPSPEAEAEYRRLGHAVQSGVAASIEMMGANAAAADPKHLRTGVNMAFIEQQALLRILIDKGIIASADEFLATACTVLEEEIARYEQMLEQHLDGKVILA